MKHKAIFDERKGGGHGRRKGACLDETQPRREDALNEAAKRKRCRFQHAPKSPTGAPWREGNEQLDSSNRGKEVLKERRP